MSSYRFDTFPYPSRLPGPKDLSKVRLSACPLKVHVDPKVGEILRGRLGAQFSHIEVDEEACADLLRAYGEYDNLYPASIAISSRFEFIGKRLADGEAKASTAFVYMGSKLLRYLQPSLPGWLSARSSETLAHELSHVADNQRRHEYDLAQENKRAGYRRVGPGVAAGLGVSLFAAYAEASIHSPVLGIGIGLVGAATSLAIGELRSRAEIHNAIVERDYELYRRQPGEIRAWGVQTIYAHDLANGGPHLIRIVQQDGSLA